jgi:hypothetical protein
MKGRLGIGFLVGCASVSCFAFLGPGVGVRRVFVYAHGVYGGGCRVAYASEERRLIGVWTLEWDGNRTLDCGERADIGEFLTLACTCPSNK